MDFPYSPEDAAVHRRARNPIALWLLVALIGCVLGAAALAASFATDTRDFAARHGSVLATRAL